MRCLEVTDDPLCVRADEPGKKYFISNKPCGGECIIVPTGDGGCVHDDIARDVPPQGWRYSSRDREAR